MFCNAGKLWLHKMGTVARVLLDCSPKIERLPITGPAIGIEKGFVDKGYFVAGTEFSLILPDPTLIIKEDGYFDGVFDSLPVAKLVVFLAERGSCDWNLTALLELTWKLFFIYEENVSLFNLEREVDFIGDKDVIIPLLLGVFSITDLLMFLGPAVDNIDFIGPLFN